MKKFLFILLLLIVLAAGGVVTMVAMSFNPTAYEKDVIAYLKRLTGREVTVDGTTKISWNPVPTVTMNNVRLANIDKSQNPIMLSIDKVQVSIAWDSLLKSPLEIRSIEVTRPTLILERLESNRANFAFPFLLDPNFQLQDMDLLSGDPSKTARIDSVAIKEGSVQYTNQITGVSLQITNINGVLAVDSVRGPFRFSGTGMSDRANYTLSADVGAFQGGAPVPLNIQLSESDTKSELALSGNLTPASTDKLFSGAAQFNIGRLDSLLNLISAPVPEVAAGASAGGSFSLEVGSAKDTLKDFIVQIGEGNNKASFTGTITRTLSGKIPGYDVSLATDAFQPDQWKTYLNAFGWNWLSGEEFHPDIAFKFVAKSLPYQSEFLKDLVLEGHYEKGELTVQKASVGLADGAAMAFNISGNKTNQGPALEVGIRAEVPSVQTVAKLIFPEQGWAMLPALAQKGNLTGRILWTPDQMTLNLNSFKIGDSDIQGSIQKTFGETNTYNLKLALSNINIDDYTGWKAPEKPVKISDLPGLIKKSLEEASWTHDLTFQGVFDVQDMTAFGLPTGRVHLDTALQDGVLQVDSLTIQNMATSNLSASATFNGIGRPQMNVDGLQLSLETKQLPLLLQKLNVTDTIPLVGQATNASFKLNLKGGREASWDVDTQMALSNANIKLSGVLETPETNPTVRDLSFEITHPNFQTFMKLVEPRFNWVPKLDGTFKATGQLSGTKEHFELKDTTVGIGLQQLNGSLSFENSQIKSLVGEIVSPSIDLERFVSDTTSLYTPAAGISGKAFDFSALNDWNLNLKIKASQLLYKDINIKQAEVQTVLQNKEFTLNKLSGFSGTSDKSPIQMTGKLDWNTTPSLTTKFNIQNIPLRADFMVLSDFAFGGGTLSVDGELKTRGNSPAEFVQGLNGQGTMGIRGGQMIGVDVEKMIPIITRAIQRNEGSKLFEPEFKRVLNSGKTILQSINGGYVIANGVVRMMDLTLDTLNATANPTQVIWDVPKRTLDISIPVVLKPLNTLPPFILGVSASVGRGIYKPNYADLAAALSNQSQTALANDLRQKEEAAKTASIQKRSDRIAESHRLIQQARLAVEEMEQQIKEFPFEKGRRLLATAKDALTLVNQGAVLEEPTDAQLIQLIEQARLVILKAEEFQRALEKETLFNTQTRVNQYQQRTQKMTAQLRAWAAGYPDIVILARLSENADQNQQIIDQLATRLKPDLTAEQAARVLASCEQAASKIEKAYQHARRFDLSAVADQVSEEGGVSGTETKTVKGSFKRSE